jgi:type IV fimbrial biogenesis protein FimT
MIELLVVMAMLAILLVVAVGGFGSTFARKRVEGLVQQIASDMQYARSEAVSRNTTVRITIGAGCYVIHTVTALNAPNGATGCTASPLASTMAPGFRALRTAPTGDSPNTTVSIRDNATYLQFDRSRGDVTTDVANVTGALDIASSQSGVGALRVSVATTGRVERCIVSGTFPGVPAC